MTFKTFAKETAFRIGLVVFPTVKPKQEETFDVEAHIARIQAAFADSVKDDLKPNV